MKILLIAYYYPPLSTGGTIRPAKMAQYLPRFGHPVSVLTHTYEKSDRFDPGLIRVRDISANKERRGIKRLRWLLLRLATEALNRFGIYHSIYAWWKNRVIRLGERIIGHAAPDLIIATYPPAETLEIGLALSHTYNIPLVCDFRDGLLFEPIEQKRMNRFHCIRRHYAHIEKEAVRHSAAITAIADPISDYFKTTYGFANSFVVSNGFDREDFVGLPGDIPLDPARFNIVFTGRFALSDRYNRADFFFDAVRLLLDQQPDLAEKLRIHLVGEYRSQELAQLRDLIDQKIIAAHGFVARERALAFQAAADLLLIITPPDRRSATSAKIFEYLCAGRPILALTHQTVLADILRGTRSGWIVHPHKPKEIAGILFRLLTDPGFYNSLNPDQKRIDQYSVQSQLEKLSHILEKLS